LFGVSAKGRRRLARSVLLRGHSRAGKKASSAAP
jgi:hypothetical protein